MQKRPFKNVFQSSFRSLRQKVWVLKVAADKCKKDKRKTINGDDLINSMEALGFDAYLPGLRIFLEKYK